MRYKIYGIALHLFFVETYTLCQFIYLFVFETFEDFASVMSILPTYLSLIVKSFNFMYNIEEIEMLLTDVEEIVEEEKFTEVLQKHLKKIDLIFKVFWISALSTCILGLLVPIFLHEIPYRMWFPFDYHSNNMLFWLTALYQTIGPIIYASVDFSQDVYPVIFMCYIFGMMEELGLRLESLKSVPMSGGKENQSECDASVSNSTDIKQKLVNCVKLQLKIRKITKQVEELFAVVIFVQGTMSTLILCTTSYALTVVSVEKL